jgi:hypothetical protein
MIERGDRTGSEDIAAGLPGEGTPSDGVLGTPGWAKVDRGRLWTYPAVGFPAPFADDLLGDLQHPVRSHG